VATVNGKDFPLNKISKETLNNIYENAKKESEK